MLEDPTKNRMPGNGGRKRRPKAVQAEMFESKTLERLTFDDLKKIHVLFEDGTYGVSFTDGFIMDWKEVKRRGEDYETKLVQAIKNWAVIPASIYLDTDPTGKQKIYVTQAPRMANLERNVRLFF